MVRAMTRIALGLLFLLLAAELAVRLVLPNATIEPTGWREANRDALCGAVRYATDGAGQRARATAQLERPLAHPLLIVGGEFTAAAGLALAERYPERLEKRALAGGFSEVVALAVADREVELRRVLQLPRADVAAGGPPAAVVRHAKGPDVVVVEIDGAIYGGDASRLAIPAAAAPLPPFAFDALRIVDAWELLQLRRSRRREEAAIVDLVQRDGLTGRASTAAKSRLEALTAAFAARRVTAEQLHFLRGVLGEVHGLRRALARAAALERWNQLFGELRDAQRAAIVLVTGPTLLSLAVAHGAEGFGHAVVHAPPYELDPQLRVALPVDRPAAVVHAQVADSLWATLTKRGLLPPEAAAPSAVIERADAIEQSYNSRGGFEESAIRLAEVQVGSHLVIARGELPLGVLAGVADDGSIEPGRAVELVLRRPSLSAEFVVRGEAPVGALPLLEFRAKVGPTVERQQVAPRVVGLAVGRPGHERVEWSFAWPASTGLIDYPGIELELLAPAAATGGAPSGPVWLREAMFIGPPPDGS